MLDLLSAESANLWDGPVTVGIVVVVHLLLPLWAAASAMRRAARAKREMAEAAAQFFPGASLVPGPRAVVHGKVEYAPGESAALRVEIEQAGTEEETKNGWYHRWNEVSRLSFPHPFYVHDVRGTRVRVEPDTRTLLLDKLDRVMPSGDKRRTRIAELLPGEEVFVVGELAVDATGTAYRSATEPTMRPPTRGPMVVASEPLEERFRRRHTDAKKAARGLVALLACLLLVDLGFYVRVALARPAVAEVTGARLVRGKNVRTKCALDLVTESGVTFQDTSSEGVCAQLHPGDTFSPGRRVPILDPGLGGWFAQVGTRPGLHFAAFWTASVLAVVGLFVYGLRERPWYEGSVIDLGKGRLPTL